MGSFRGVACVRLADVFRLRDDARVAGGGLFACCTFAETVRPRRSFILSIDEL